MTFSLKTFSTHQIWNTLTNAWVTSCVLYILLIPHGVLADYRCVCSRHLSRTVYSKTSTVSTPLGYLYQGECKEFIHNGGNHWASVAFSHNVGYVKLDFLTVVSSCSGDPSVNDRVTTSTVQTTATTTGQSSATVVPTGTPASTQSQSSSTATSSGVQTSSSAFSASFTLSQTSTPSPTMPGKTIRSTTPKLSITTTLKQPQLVIGHTHLCPSHVQDHSKKHGAVMGQYGGKCYMLTTREVYNWGQGETLCRSGQGHLASIESHAEQNYVRQLIHNYNHFSRIWIGLNDIQQEGVFRWSSGARSTYNNLRQLPSEIWFHQAEDCATFSSDSGDWHMSACLEVHPVLCQFHITQNGGIIG